LARVPPCRCGPRQSAGSASTRVLGEPPLQIRLVVYVAEPVDETIGEIIGVISGGIKVAL